MTSEEVLAGQVPARTLEATAVTAVLFDVDDTLVDTRSAFAHALETVVGEFIPDLTAEGRELMLTTWRADGGGHYRRFTRGEISFREQRHARAIEVHEVVGGPPLVDAEVFDHWNSIYSRAFTQGWTPFEDASAVVGEVLRRGLGIGALTNAGAEQQRAKLEATGFSAHMPLLVTLDTFGVGKPDRRLFLEACRLLGSEPAATIYVGDELDIDARAAHAAGLRGVWLDRPGRRRGGRHEEDADLARSEGLSVISSLTELGDLL